ncbi:MAG: sulfatase-like hydrolase/transferase [Lentimonas sp.]
MTFRILFFVLLAHLALAANAAKNRPNVLVILLDDAGYNDFGFMGSQQILTPNMDKLAASGMTFSDAHLSGTTCSPSRAGIMTGRYQQRFGYHNNVPPHGSGLDPAESTMGDAFQASGYKTYYIGKWHLGSVEKYFPNNRGFGEFYGLLEGSRSYFPAKEDVPGGTKAIQHNGEFLKWEGYLTELFTEAALDYLEDAQEEPFFMFLSYTAPHGPMHAKAEHLEKFKGHPRAKLASMFWSADEGVGQVLAKLDALKLRENTLIFLLSDNGGAEANQSNNAPLKGYKGSKFEGGHRTPFVMSWPGKIPANSKFDGLISAMDLYPTAAAAAGVSTTLGKPLDGVNLLPYVNGEASGDPHAMLFWHRSVEDGVRAGDFKLVGHEAHGWRLYNLEKDIGEANDLFKQHPELTEQLLQQLSEWKQQHTEPQWPGSAIWNKVKKEEYRALMNHQEPLYKSPQAMKKYLKAHPEAE